MKTKTMCALAVLAVLSVGAARAQEPAPEPEPKPTGRPPRGGTTLQVQAVVSRSKAGKTTSRLPYTVTCIADGAGRPSILKLGVEVPVAVGGGKGVQYRNVGTNIDCSCEPIDDQRYRLKIAVEQSSISDLGRSSPRSQPASGAAADEAGEGGNPMFRTFMSSFSAILRDGQSAVSTSATDPVTADDVTIDVTLKVLK
ncbi:MAG TPA: hypothetical protein VFQ51_07765 [Vicinamibacteria bacterium]|nr:hypothetical protein [Vicinamibacteria bacterium]